MPMTARTETEAAHRADQQAMVWLREAAWPLWLEHGIDWRRRAFLESLDLRDRTCPAGFRRLRVAARQVYVFAEAHRAGLPRAAEAVELGLAFLHRHALGEDGGYASRFGLEGQVLDARRDTYDQAFVLLALASATAVLPAAPLHRAARALLGFLDTRLAHPRGGYREGLPEGGGPRRQNPHMHLLEAFLAAAAAFGDPLFRERAEAMLALFLDRLLDRRHGTLPEYYDEALAPLAEGGRYAVEPGHHCEWVWLLRDCAAWAGPGRAALEGAQAALLGFVDRHGLNPALGTLYDEVWQDGAVRADASRLWPQTERLKAEALRPDASPAGRLAAHAALRRYLRPDGLWHERLRADGTPVEEPAPASSLYHLTAGILVAARADAPQEDASGDRAG